jgi:hypothetical protein
MMRSVLAVTCGWLVVLGTVTVSLAGALSAQCVDGLIVIDASFFNDGNSDDWLGLVVTRDWVGACDDPVIITPEPWPLPALWELGHYAMTDVPPEADTYFGYRLWGIDDEGELIPVMPSGDTLQYDFAACGAAVAVRGFLIGDPPWEIYVGPCPGTCWDEICDAYEPVDVSGVAPDVYEPYLDSGIPVDLYGRAVADGMPVSPCLMLEDVQPTVDGECGPIPTTPSSWSTVKARYR